MIPPVERADPSRVAGVAPRRSRAAAALAVAAALVVGGALALDLGWGAEVTLLHALKSPEEQEEWRRLRAPADDPAEIYGQPEGPALRVLLLGDLPAPVQPVEAPGRLLLAVDRTGSRVPLQTRTLWRYAALLAAPLLLTAALLAVWTKRRGRRPS